MEDSSKQSSARLENIYQLDGRVPLDKAIPFGLQHVLAMFIANLAPIAIIGNVVHLDAGQMTILLQNAMFVAGIGSLIQLYSIGGIIGARLPIIMGVSFTFVSVLSFVGSSYGYSAIVGCVIAGGIFEGTLGLTARYWRKLISPIVSATVVTAIGYSLLSVGTRSLGGGYNENFGSAQNVFLGLLTLISCIGFTALAKGFHKQLSILFGLVVGYIAAIAMGVVNLNHIFDSGLFSLPHFMPFTPEFHAGAIISTCIIYLVSAAETIGDTSAMTAMGQGRETTEKEISGSLGCDGSGSAISGLFGCTPITSFSQNVGLIAMTGVVNRFTIATGACCMILGGLIPPIGALFSSLPEAVLGGCTIMLFGSIMVSGIRMLAACGFSQRNVIIASLSLSIGLGFTYSSELGIWKLAPQVIKDVFAANCVALVFVISLALNLLLPQNMEIEAKGLTRNKPTM